MDKLERFRLAFQHLKNSGIAHTQRDVAKKMGATPPNVSSAMRGDEKFLTGNFLRRFNLAYGGIFNEDWLIDGVGQMLCDSPPKNDTAAIVNNQVGNGNHFTNGSTVERFLDELAAQRELTREAQQQLTKSQEQMDRLITIIEQLKH